MGDLTTVMTTLEPSGKSSFSHYQDLLIGCILAIGGNLMISVSLNLQKFTHMKNEQMENPVHYTRNPLWWLGLVLMVVGEVGNFSAYGFAPASLVAPLGTTTVVANMFLAAIFLKEKVCPEHLFGSALAVVGAVLLVAFSSSKEKVLTGEMLNEAFTQTSFIVYICLELFILGVLFFLLYYMKMKRVVIYILITAIIASFTVISAKGVSSMVQLSFAGVSQFTYPVLYLMTLTMIVTAIIQVKYLNQAMKNFNSTIVVPTNFVFFTVSAIVAGIVFYKEFYGMSTLQIFMFLFGCIMSFVGVYFIVAGKGSIKSLLKATKDTEEDPDAESAAINNSVFPAWLLATVNVGQVQPSGNMSHLKEDEASYSRPFLAADELASSSEDDTVYSTADSAAQSPAHKQYGTQEYE